MPLNPAPKVSVIVPVYNTELYVERAIVSLMEQTLDDVQFIIIDDGSKDNSFNLIKKVIARYPERESQVILMSRQNRGVAATRAQGLELATGEYVIHLDSDDWAELNWLQVMYTKAMEENADVVVCDYFEEFDNKQLLVNQADIKSGLDGVKKLFCGGISNSNWNKMVSQKLMKDNNICFQAGLDMGEDFIVSFMVFFYSKKVKSICSPLYHYNRSNVNALTQNYSSKALADLVKTVDFVELFLMRNYACEELHEEILNLKMNTKSLHIISSHIEKFLVIKAFEIYPETHPYILKSKLTTLKICYLLYTLRLLPLCRLVLLSRTLIKLVR
ncbi:glycosyltransferase family 2 protein [Shewanella sp. S23-S33]|uniref:glycosyltransferase family 2 protein n=1 Tax=Shewanella sp. S23-S33 TaxID=3342769 RepID=UPI00372CF522